MDEVEEIQNKRFKFLLKLYKMSQGSPNIEFNQDDIGKLLDFDPYLTVNIVHYLGNEGLIVDNNWYGVKGVYEHVPISITNKGIKEVEQVIKHPQTSTEHFPSEMIYDIKITGNLSNSPFQIGSPYATQSITINEDNIKDVEELIKLLKESIRNFNLTSRQEEEIKADIHTIDTQMPYYKSKTPIIIQCLKSIANIMTGISSATTIVDKISYILGHPL